MPWCGVGAKVHPRMYADMERVAAFHNIGLSDIIREGVALYLQASGIDQGFRIEAEALEAAQARLREYEAKAATLRPKVPVAALSRQLREPAYRVEALREAARLHPEEVATAVRMWTRPQTHAVILDAVMTEALMPPPMRFQVGPPILRVLRQALGSYDTLAKVLAEETGVAA